MPLGRKFAIGSEEARRQRAELRITYGNKLSNINLGRLRNRVNPLPDTATTGPRAVPGTTSMRIGTAAASYTTSLHRIASSFAHVSDVVCGSCAALPHEDSEEDVNEERAEVLIRSEPFKQVTGMQASLLTKTASSYTMHDNCSHSHSHRHSHSRGHSNEHSLSSSSLAASAAAVARMGDQQRVDAAQSRASERWGQIACTVSALFRVRRITHANPMSELRRLREQRDLLEAFTRPFLYEDNTHAK